jgi:hypothetical protein
MHITFNLIKVYNYYVLIENLKIHTEKNWDRRVDWGNIC